MVHGLDRGKEKEGMFVKFSDDIKLGGVVIIIDDRAQFIMISPDLEIESNQ